MLSLKRPLRGRNGDVTYSSKAFPSAGRFSTSRKALLLEVVDLEEEEPLSPPIDLSRKKKKKKVREGEREIDDAASH